MLLHRDSRPMLLHRHRSVTAIHVLALAGGLLLPLRFDRISTVTACAPYYSCYT